MAAAATHIMDTVRVESAKAKEAARNDNNEFNIRKNFLDNAVAAIRDATYSQFNIVICTDQAHDDFQNLTGQILPMDLIDVEVSQGKIVNFQVYVFETGKYLRHGKWERDHWWWWGESKKFTDPFAMHVHFEKAQPKLDAAQIKQKQDEEKKKQEEAEKAKKAAEQTQVHASEHEAQALDINAQSQAEDASYLYGAQQGEVSAAPSHPPMAPVGFTNRELP